MAESIRAAFDFNLHMVPNLVLFSFLVGGMGANCLTFSTTEGPQASRLVKVGVLLFLFLFGAFGNNSIRREVVAFPLWLKVESARANEEEVLPKLYEYSLSAPSYYVLRQVGRALIEKEREQGLKQAIEIWQLVVKIHPFDGEGLANYAYCLDNAGEFSQAEGYHLRALEAVARRENKYGVVYGVGWHLIRRADHASKLRRPGEALFLYQASREAFAESHRLNFSRRKLNREVLGWLEQQIQFLEGARIEPVEVEILDWRSKLP
ncbi:hypothetical protein GCM10007100_36030 [Roseibacillus persicicus]|uniref:Tetratricopeptide repeat protein n=1 Tax=Roseibacillus persicicus TaxID=454148 RepID=A0A918TWI9_9BACT|nr:hypothetical protein GCM10007100_36030 [Roseibacillus persicicus]